MNRPLLAGVIHRASGAGVDAVSLAHVDGGL